MPTDGLAKGAIFGAAERYIGQRVTASLEAIDPKVIVQVIDTLLKAPAVFVYGAGRSGIIGRAFAMRLVQTGLSAYVIGESVTPIVHRGDAVFIVSNRGESSSSTQTANIVRREGAELIVVTARSTSKLAHAASYLISLDFPEDRERPSFAPLGTLFESAALRLSDALIAELLVARGESEDSMRRRHAIMV
ncbi:MAG: SIS domain-containing protein [Thermoplasmata archaeon]|nr:SIS domain-containing protein [Thermoplasmata archaeon]